MADGVETPQVNEINSLERLTPVQGPFDLKGEIPGLANRPAPPAKQKETAAPGSSRDGGQSSKEGGNPQQPGYHEAGEDAKSNLLSALANFESDLADIACPFEGVDFRHIEGRGFDLSGRNLSGREFTHGDYALAKFDGSVLEGALLDKADFRHSQFVLSDLSFARLSGSDFSVADFRAARLQRATARGVNFNHCDFRAARLEWADLRRANFQDARFEDARFASLNSDSTLFRFGLSYLFGCPEMAGANVADMEGANLRNADLGPLVFVGRAAAGTQLREMLLWSSVLGGAVVHVGHLARTPAAFRELVNSAADDPQGLREVIACLDFLESLIPLARARKAAELGVTL